MKIKYGRRIICGIGFLTILLMLTACGKPQGGGPQGGAPEVAVVTIQPERVTIITELPGRTSAYLVAEVRPR